MGITSDRQISGGGQGLSWPKYLLAVSTITTDAVISLLIFWLSETRKYYLECQIIQWIFLIAFIIWLRFHSTLTFPDLQLCLQKDHLCDPYATRHKRHSPPTAPNCRSGAALKASAWLLYPQVVPVAGCCELAMHRNASTITPIVLPKISI